MSKSNPRTIGGFRMQKRKKNDETPPAAPTSPASVDITHDARAPFGRDDPANIPTLPVTPGADRAEASIVTRASPGETISLVIGRRNAYFGSGPATITITKG
jgi:hypothetical protein